MVAAVVVVKVMEMMEMVDEEPEALDFLSKAVIDQDQYVTGVTEY